MTSPVSARFELVDHAGRTVTEEDYRGKWMLIYFGFTNCEVVCPRTLGKLDAVLEDLGPLVDKIEPLFISVDPLRDTPQAMSDYLSSGHARFTGLTGSSEQSIRAQQAFRVFVHERGSGPSSTAHTAFTYLIDPSGQYATHWPESADGSRIARDLSDRIQADEQVAVAAPTIAVPAEPSSGCCCEH